MEWCFLSIFSFYSVSFTFSFFLFLLELFSPSPLQHIRKPPRNYRLCVSRLYCGKFFKKWHLFLTVWYMNYYCAILIWPRWILLTSPLCDIFYINSFKSPHHLFLINLYYTDAQALWKCSQYTHLYHSQLLMNIVLIFTFPFVLIFKHLLSLFSCFKFH